MITDLSCDMDLSKRGLTSISAWPSVPAIADLTSTALPFTKGLSESHCNICSSVITSDFGQFGWPGGRANEDHDYEMEVFQLAKARS